MFLFMMSFYCEDTDNQTVNHGRGSSDLLDALVKELEAGVTVADEGTLLDELSEHLRPAQLTVELLLRSVPRLQETCRTKMSRYSQGLRLILRCGFKFKLMHHEMTE